ncbi:hypothetical protein MUP37_01590, partial [Candidatus Bathyarchaeota archaeon]|nr:hypothetical protein [Candidatus Bathyarchaeota archaeon]
VPEVQPVEYNQVTRAVPETGIREAVSGIPGCRSSFGHAICPLYKNCRDIILHKAKDQVCCESGIISPEYRWVFARSNESTCLEDSLIQVYTG